VHVSDSETDAVHDIVGVARTLASLIVASRDDAEQMRQTPPALAKAIADARQLFAVVLRQSSLLGEEHETRAY
jgi:hypothetical protein